MKLIYIAKLNLFVYASENNFLSKQEKEAVRDDIKAQLSGITPNPQVLVMNASFEIVPDKFGLVESGRQYQIIKY